MVFLLDARKWWECPSCHFQTETNDPRPMSPLHPCHKQAGLQVPLVEIGEGDQLDPSDVRHRLNTRQDYVGAERGIVFGPNGAAISSVQTERADGSSDVSVYAPTAGGKE